MFRICLVLATSLMTLIGMQSSQGADIRKSNDPRCSFTLSGDIVKGDAKKIGGLSSKLGDTLCLDSQGGSFIEGLDIAYSLSFSGIYTALLPGAECYSACAFAFMGGGEMEETAFFPHRKMSTKARLGFHAPYILPKDNVYTPENVKEAYSLGLDAVSRMMELGNGAIPSDIIIRLLRSGPSELFLIDNPALAKSLHITISDAPRATWDEQAACNACGNEYSDGPVKCTRPKITELPNDTRQFDFEGFGAEASYYCSVRVTKTKTGAIKAAISKLAVDEDFPLNPKSFHALNDSDALGSFTGQ